VLGGIGLAGFGVFGTFGASGLNDSNNLHSTCAPGCTDAQVQPVRMKLIAADIGLGVGVVSLVAAIWIGVRGLTHSPSPSAQGASRWELAVDPSPSGVRGNLAVRF
jgi:hypothetical protein